MKSNRIRLTVLGLAILMIPFQFTAFSAGNRYLDTSGQAYFEEYFAYEEFNELLDIKLKQDLNIKIYDLSNDLVATGNEDDEKMKSIIPLADLVTEINGTKYYRLSY